MSKQIEKTENVKNAHGIYSVSTIQTLAGGATASRRMGFGPSEEDFLDETPWPYETMIRKSGEGFIYHLPLISEAEARKHHALIVKRLLNGEDVHGGVTGPFSVPSTTPEEWRKIDPRCNARIKAFRKKKLAAEIANAKKELAEL